MFHTLLVANRGEIARRIMRTAAAMGLRTVAVYSDADRDALHVLEADEAHPLGPAPARESYLRADRIIAAALGSGAQAIHPGYGFLSENADFAQAVADAGLVFVGPPPDAIRAMGSKAAAKALMERAGVPLVPGYHGESQDPALLAAEAARIGFPVLIKASAGGGGRGMRVVERADAFAPALDAARRESLASFADDRVLIEKYLASPRHIEVQVFADGHGRTLSLFERDCSVQRRHQKVLEEAPAPGMDADRRRRMGEAATSAARAVGYRGAGTVEFICPGGEDGGDDFFFMEMNTRLQVEHPVTELVTGLDLVEWQLRVAAGEPLPDPPARPHGHAIEARLCAEDPARGFLPSTGRLLGLREPPPAPGLRIDSGVREGDSITPHYDSLVAKVIAHGRDRDEALARLCAALAQYEVAGVRTNLALLRAIASHPDFAAARLSTGFIAEHPELLAPADAAPPPAALAAAALFLLAEGRAAVSDPHSPWATADGWRLNAPAAQDLPFAGPLAVRAHLPPDPDGDTRLDLPAGPARAALLPAPDGGSLLRLDGVTHRARVLRDGPSLLVLLDGEAHVLHPHDPLAPPDAASAASNRVSSPIPARVVRVLATPGARVARGAPLLLLEAMKTEITLSAPADATVAAVRAEVGDMVEEGAELVTFEEEGK